MGVWVCQFPTQSGCTIGRLLVLRSLSETSCWQNAWLSFIEPGLKRFGNLFFRYAPVQIVTLARFPYGILLFR